MANTFVAILMLCMVWNQLSGQENEIMTKCEACLKADTSQSLIGQINCYNEARNSLEYDMNKFFFMMLDVLGPEEKEKLKAAHFQWLALKEREFDFAVTFYCNMSDQKWRVEASKFTCYTVLQRFEQYHKIYADLVNSK